jgi:excisionase family DNA binding protein
MTVDRAHESTMSRDASRWLSPQEVCDELRIPKQTFYQWRARHVAPPAYRFGKLLRIDRAEFEEWLANHAEHFSSR